MICPQPRKKNGRPRKYDYKEIYKLLDEGLSAYKVRIILNLKNGVVWNAIRNRRKENGFEKYKTAPLAKTVKKFAFERSGKNKTKS